MDSSKTMSENTIFCPRCDSNEVVKNGLIHNGNQNFKCKQCGRQFVFNPRNKPIAQETKDLIDKLLQELLPLAGIARVTGVSERWLQNYVNTLYASVSNGTKLRQNPDSTTVVLQELVRADFRRKRNKTAFFQLPKRESFRRNKFVVLLTF